MAIEVPQNEEISGGGKNGRRKGVGVTLCQCSICSHFNLYLR